MAMVQATKKIEWSCNQRYAIASFRQSSVECQSVFLLLATCREIFCNFLFCRSIFYPAIAANSTI